MKCISNEDLASLVAELLRNPSSPEFADQDQFQQFMSDIAEVVCQRVGGETAADFQKVRGTPAKFFIGIRGNSKTPADGGVWSSYDAQHALWEPDELVVMAAQFTVMKIAPNKWAALFPGEVAISDTPTPNYYGFVGPKEELISELSAEIQLKARMHHGLTPLHWCTLSDEARCRLVREAYEAG